MRIATLTLAMIFAISGVVLGQSEASAKRAIASTFKEYLTAKWSERQDLMSERAWVAYVGDMLLANQNKAIKTLAEFDINEYEYPEIPTSSIHPPSEKSIKATAKIRKVLVTDLSKKLRMRWGQFLDQLDRNIAIEFDSSNIQIQKIKLAKKHDSATAELRIDRQKVTIPLRFINSKGVWKFDGKDEIQFYARQR